jgi:hypothetical protein
MAKFGGRSGLENKVALLISGRQALDHTIQNRLQHPRLRFGRNSRMGQFDGVIG